MANATSDSKALPSLRFASGGTEMVGAVPPARTLVRQQSAVEAPKLLVVGIEGNISSGKSTLCRNLSGYTVEGRVVRPSMETISRDLLGLFYGDMEQYAFALQLNTMSRRLMTLSHLPHQLRATKEVALLDRCVMGDAIFFIKNWLSLYIRPDQALVYMEEMRLHRFGDMLRDKGLDAIFYLHSTPHGCRRNVASRADVDKDVVEDYLNELDDLYFYAILWLMLHDEAAYMAVYVRDWRTFGNYEEFAEDLGRKLIARTDHKFRSRVVWDVSAESPTPKMAADGRPASPFVPSPPSTVSSAVPTQATTAGASPPSAPVVSGASAAGAALDAKLNDVGLDSATMTTSTHPAGAWWWCQGTTTFLVYDDEERLQRVTDPKYLPRLPTEWRVRHTQVWKDRLASELSRGQTVQLVRRRTGPCPTLLDLYDRIPEILLQPDSVTALQAQRAALVARVSALDTQIRALSPTSTGAVTTSGAAAALSQQG